MAKAKNSMFAGSFDEVKKATKKIDGGMKRLPSTQKESLQQELDQASQDYNDKLKNIQKSIEESLKEKKKEDKYQPQLFQAEPKFKVSEATKQALNTAKRLVSDASSDADKELLKELTESYAQDKFTSTDNEKLQFMVLRLMSQTLTQHKLINNPNAHEASPTSLSKLTIK